MEKKERGSPIIHPSLAGNAEGRLQPAQKGKSRIAPGSKRGANIHEKMPLAAALAAPKEIRIPQVEIPNHPASHTVVGNSIASTNDMSDEDVLETLSALAPEVSDPALLDNKIVKRQETLRKLLSFTQVMQKTVKIADMDFEFTVPTPAVNLHVAKIFAAFDASEQTLFRNRVLKLSAALSSIDGVTLESTYEGPLKSDLVLMRYSILMTWNVPVLEVVLQTFEKTLEDIREDALPDFLRQAKTVTKD